MGSTDLASHKIRSIGGKRAVATFADNINSICIKRELSLEAEYQSSEDAAISVTNRLLQIGDLETLSDLWAKFGKPKCLQEIDYEIGVTNQELIRQLMEREELIQEIKKYAERGDNQSVLDIISEKERKSKFLRKSLLGFSRDEKSYLAKR